MFEATAEQLNVRVKQFDAAIKSVLAYGGTIIAGVVVKKTAWPGQEGKNPSWNVELSYFGATVRVSVSQRLFDSIGLGSYQLLQVTQRASSNSLYSTAIEP